MNKKETDIIGNELEARMNIFDIRDCVEAIEKNRLPFEEKNFEERFELIDYIGFELVDQMDALLREKTYKDELVSLKCKVEKVRTELEGIDKMLFQRLREGIRSGIYRGAEFRKLIDEYADVDPDKDGNHNEPGYDILDVFVNGLTSFQAMPEQTMDLEPEMVFFQKTPARVVFEMVGSVPFSKNDVFYDLGSGLGQVIILVNLLTGVKAKGLEFEPAFCDYANRCSGLLDLQDVSFVNVDARNADISDGTVFFMFTPFRGEIMQDVLKRLKDESRVRKIRIISYGPCTAHIAQQSWLHAESREAGSAYKLAIFSS